MQINADKFNPHLRLSACICGQKKIWARPMMLCRTELSRY